jgi:hypothetical protein
MDGATRRGWRAVGAVVVALVALAGSSPSLADDMEATKEQQATEEKQFSDPASAVLADAMSEPLPAQDDPHAPVSYETFFTQRDDSFEDTSLETVIIGLVGKAPAGSQVRVAMSSWTRVGTTGALTNAFINAHRRGVDVHFIVGKDSRNSPALNSAAEQHPRVEVHVLRPGPDH